MLKPQYMLPLADELVVDLFAGGGGASTGIEQAIGRHVDIAINHDSQAIAMHEMNHPQTEHFCSDVFEVDPIVATKGRRVGLLWLSPDCKHFSKAKGGKPVEKGIRSLAWVAHRWAGLPENQRPRLICLENVKEFETWGPLTADNKPCQKRKGTTFNLWVKQLENLGYKVEWRMLRACDYGAPTIRERLFIVAVYIGDGSKREINWPMPTHGDPSKPETKANKLKPWLTAADCIDWSLPCPSIFERTRPLKENTLRRIARGIIRYVLEGEPFIVETAHSDVSQNGVKRWGKGIRNLQEPLTTVLASGNGAALCVPFVSSYYGHKTLTGEDRGTPLEAPLKTQTTENRHALVSAFLAKHYTGVVGSDLEKPIGTVTSVDHHSLVAANMIHLRGTGVPTPCDQPLRTVAAGGLHSGLVAALLVKYYGNEKDGVNILEPMHTIPTKDRFGLVLVHIGGEPYVITDIGMRMLQPHELYAAQGFPTNYQFDRKADGTALPKSAQVRMCGNSVCPPIAEALVRANYSAG